jgi:hypothetical protein
MESGGSVDEASNAFGFLLCQKPLLYGIRRKELASRFLTFLGQKQIFKESNSCVRSTSVEGSLNRSSHMELISPCVNFILSANLDTF